MYKGQLEPPEGLAAKLAMFASNGRVFREHNELFTETSWLSVLVGQNAQAGGYHPVADMIDDQETLDRLAHIRGVVAQTAEAMPTQTAFLRQQGSAIA